MTRLRLTPRAHLLLGWLLTLLLILIVGGAEALGYWVTGVKEP